MKFTLYAGQGCLLTRKVSGAAHICGHEVVQSEVKEMDSEGQTFKRYPALMTPSGLVGGSNAACRYIANTNAASELYGRSVSERAMVDAMLDAVAAEIECPIIAAKKNGVPSERVTADLKVACESMDKTLFKQTYLVGERLTIADLAAAGALVAASERKLIDLSVYPSLCRMVNTVSGRCGWKFAVEAKVTVTETAKSVGKENKKAEKPKAAEKKKAAKEEDDEDVPPPAPKVKDPIDELPPTNFDMDAWKRMYSNSKDLKGEAMPYLWEKLDREGYAFWHLSYIRYNDTENVKEFMASNLASMFLQRMDNWLRKHMFGVLNVFEEVGYYSIEGVMMMRGQVIPKRLAEHDQYESFVWTKLELPKDTQLITDYFCESDKINNKVIADCKVYK